MYIYCAERVQDLTRIDYGEYEDEWGARPSIRIYIYIYEAACIYTVATTTSVATARVCVCSMHGERA